MTALLAPVLRAQDDTTPPTLVKPSIDNWTMLLSYSEDLDSESIPPASAFAVMVTPQGGAEASRTVDRVDLVSNYVVLNLSTRVAWTDDVTLSCFGSVPPVRDLAGNPAATFTGLSVVNQTPHAPSAPQNLSASPGVTTVTLSREWPSDSGYSAIKSYEYRVDGTGGRHGAGTDLTETVRCLENDASYVFEVRAVNYVGAGPAATVRCELMAGGVELETIEIPLEANGQTSWFVDEAFTPALTTDFLGSVHCVASGNAMFTESAFDLAHRIFTTLPVAPVDESL